MKRRKSTIETMNVSFLDVIGCALGGTLLLLLVSKQHHAEATAEAEDRLSQVQIAEKTLQEKVDLLESQNKKNIDENQLLSRKLDSLLEDQLREIELVFVMDATGSMGDQFADLRINIESAVEILSKLSPDLRVGFVTYWDKPAAEITAAFPITRMDVAGIAKLRQFVATTQIGKPGNEDYEEAVELGLQRAADLDWSQNTRNIIVLIGDAACRESEENMAFSIVRDFTSRYDHSFVSTILTADASTLSQLPRFQPFFKEIAKLGGGEFVADKGRLLENILSTTIGTR